MRRLGSIADRWRFAGIGLTRTGWVTLLVVGLSSAQTIAWPAPQLERGETAQTGPAFPVPPKLKPAIRFWTDLFTRHDSGRIVLHDRENMELVWRVLELPRDADGKVIRKQVVPTVRKAIDELQQRLRRLQRKPEPRDEEDGILLALAGGPDSRFLPGAWRRIRSQRGVADRFQLGLTRAQKLLPDIEQILKDEGVPPEIAALPFVESMFNPYARSSAGAAGLWQLMPATARDLGLKVTSDKDERLDVKMATRAAARMLRKNYEMLGTWPLAITGYNHGPYGVRRAVQSVGSTDLWYLIEHYDQATWGFASKNFYAEFLAATAVFAHQEETFATLVRRESVPPKPSVPP